MDVCLTPALIEFIELEVAGGLYETADEVVVPACAGSRKRRSANRTAKRLSRRNGRRGRCGVLEAMLLKDVTKRIGHGFASESPLGWSNGQREPTGDG